MKLQGVVTYPNSEQDFYDAERFADQWAGDNCGYAVVVEDYENDQIHVMDQEDAEGFMSEWDSRVIYRADHRDRCHTCENVITDRVIRSQDRTYCSFVCLDKHEGHKGGLPH